MDPRQCIAIVPEALHLALFLIPQVVSGTKKRDCNGLKLFGRIATITCAILLVYGENNLGHGSPRFRRKPIQLLAVGKVIQPGSSNTGIAALCRTESRAIPV